MGYLVMIPHMNNPCNVYTRLDVSVSSVIACGARIFILLSSRSFELFSVLLLSLVILLDNSIPELIFFLYYNLAPIDQSFCISPPCIWNLIHTFLYPHRNCD